MKRIYLFLLLSAIFSKGIAQQPMQMKGNIASIVSVCPFMKR